MPRSTFGVSTLQGATPGLSKLAASIAGDGAYEGAFDKGLTLQSKLAQAVAQIRANNAAADAHQATADQTQAETGVLTGRGDAIDNAVAMQTGSTLPMVRAVQEFTRTGVMPMKPAMGPAEEDGTQASQFPAVDSGSQSKIAQALSRMLPLRTNLKDTKPDDLANAGKIYREGDLGDAILSGRLNRNDVAGSQMAVAGKPIYHALENGTVLDQGTGVLNEGGGLAKANVGLVGQKQKSEQALAAERYAAAGQHSASAAKTRQEIEQGLKTGNLKLEKDADGNIVVVDLGKGTVRTATDTETGLPVKGKGKDAKDIPASVNGKIIEGKQGVRNIDAAIAAIEANPSAMGFENMIPGMQTVKQVTDPNGVGVRAQVANIGSLKLHDRSGAAVSASEFPRLAPFIPSAADSPKAAVSKLREMKRIAEEELGLYTDTYSAENGYRVPVAKPAAPAAASAAAPGDFKYLGKE